MKPGTVITIPDLAGRWSIWSKSDECTGAHYVVPVDDAARSRGKWATVKITRPKSSSEPLIVLLSVTAKSG